MPEPMFIDCDKSRAYAIFRDRDERIWDAHELQELIDRATFFPVDIERVEKSKRGGIFIGSEFTGADRDKK